MSEITWRRHGEARVWSGICYDAYGPWQGGRNVGTIRQDDFGWFHLYALAGFFNGAPSTPLTGLRTIEEAQAAANVLLTLKLRETL